MKKRAAVFSKILFLIVIIFGFLNCSKDNSVNPSIPNSNFQFTADESSKIKIGLYLDNGVWDGLKAPMKTMLNEMRCNYSIITKDSILNGKLNNYNMLIMPGGDMWVYKDYITANGMKKIKDFVSGGGGYLGICGGAYFGTNKIIWKGWAGEPRINISIVGLNLASVDSDGPIEDFAPTYKDIRCKVNIVGKDHPVAHSVPDMIEIYYDHGPKFLFNDPDISSIGKTVSGNNITMIAFSCGNGKVFLTGPHPEMDDTRVSWLLVKNAIKWCSNN